MTKKEEQKTEGRKHPGGRPSEYKPEYVKKVDEYIQLSLKQNKTTTELPTLVGLAIYFDKVVNTLKNWGKEHPEFLTALRKLQAYQKRELINRGLLGTYNSTIAKLILSSNHGMTERIDQTSGDEPMRESLTTEEVIKRLKAIQESGDGIDWRSINGTGHPH
ncbi:MAG: terminase small subunit [Planctomycetota bacterium]|jgi:hypothetical protein